MKNIFWKDYWSDKTHGEHRSQSEDFLEKESKEKLFHLGAGGKLLDFGCGSADLLAYYARNYEFSIGADWSASMINRAQERLDSFDLQGKYRLFQSDDNHIWEIIDNELGKDFRFDCITAGQVIQYFNKEQVDHFISNAFLHLSDKGKICLFDIVDSRTYELWRAGLFNREYVNLSVLGRILVNRLRIVKNRLSGKPLHDLGYIYPPALFMELGRKYNLNVSFAHSMYYEYRYHIIFSKQH